MAADRVAYRVPVRILVVTQMWPSPERPELGAFVERQVRALERLGAEVAVASIPPGPGGFRAPLKWARLFAAAEGRRPRRATGRDRRALPVPRGRGRPPRRADGEGAVRRRRARPGRDQRGAGAVAAPADAARARRGGPRWSPSRSPSPTGWGRSAPSPADAAGRAHGRRPHRVPAGRPRRRRRRPRARAAPPAGRAGRRQERRRPGAGRWRPPAASCGWPAAATTVAGARMLGLVPPAAVPRLLRAGRRRRLRARAGGIRAWRAGGDGVRPARRRVAPVSRWLPTCRPSARCSVDPLDVAAIEAGLRGRGEDAARPSGGPGGGRCEQRRRHGRASPARTRSVTVARWRSGRRNGAIRGAPRRPPRRRPARRRPRPSPLPSGRPRGCRTT